MRRWHYRGRYPGIDQRLATTKPQGCNPELVNPFMVGIRLLNSLLTGLAIPTVISTTGVAARKVQSLTQPFANVLHSTLDQLSGNGSGSAAENVSRDLDIPLDANDPHLALLGKLLTGKPIQQLDRGIRIPDIRTHADSLRNKFERKLQQALLDAGVDVGSEVRLRINPGDGVVEVMDDHPQRVAIEALFANDPNLSSDFRQLVAMNQLLQAADAHRDFAQAYEDNPWQAVSTYRHLFNGQQEAVLHTTFSGDEARFDFQLI